MTGILKTIELIEDKRQEKKVRHKLLDIKDLMTFGLFLLALLTFVFTFCK